MKLHFNPSRRGEFDGMCAGRIAGRISTGVYLLINCILLQLNSRARIHSSCPRPLARSRPLNFDPNCTVNYSTAPSTSPRLSRPSARCTRSRPNDDFISPTTIAHADSTSRDRRSVIPAVVLDCQVKISRRTQQLLSPSRCQATLISAGRK